MRRTAVVAGVALIASLALAVLPGPTTSSAPSPASPVDPTTFTIFEIPATPDDQPVVGRLDAARGSAGRVSTYSTFAEPGKARTSPARRPRVDQPGAPSGKAWKPPRYTLTGVATFYDNGTTAMRLPAGTVIVVCMAGGCLQRVVNDYGPASTSRIIDLSRADFFDICGCPSWSGVEPVTVKVY